MRLDLYPRFNEELAVTAATSMEPVLRPCGVENEWLSLSSYKESSAMLGVLDAECGDMEPSIESNESLQVERRTWKIRSRGKGCYVIVTSQDENNW